LDGTDAGLSSVNPDHEPCLVFGHMGNNAFGRQAQFGDPYNPDAVDFEVVEMAMVGAGNKGGHGSAPVLRSTSLGTS
jgi:hypothetical protein